MTKLLLGTNTVSMDEPCLGLYEHHMQSPGSRGFRRYQIIVVMRGDKPVEFRRDLGPASYFVKRNIAPFRIPGGAVDEETGRFHVEHNVGELVDIADILRDERHTVEPSVDLVSGFYETLDKRHRRRNGRVQFGFRPTMTHTETT